MFLSVFDIFKIGIGPSSSHTMGPMRAATAFLLMLQGRAAFTPARVEVRLFGSLALTGKGHATDRAVLLGLLGFQADTMDIAVADRALDNLHTGKSLTLPNGGKIAFDPEQAVVFDFGPPLPQHPNGMRITATDAAGGQLSETYLSIGGGFIVTAAQFAAQRDAGNADLHAANLSAGYPYPFGSAAEMLAMGADAGLTIAQMKRANEETSMPADQVQSRLQGIFDAMQDCIARGLSRGGTLPGGLNVQRRAKTIFDRLLAAHGDNTQHAHTVNDWLLVYGMAVNEENAAGGRVVTSPTNGAAGVVPAVLRYYLDHCAGASRDHIGTFLLTAGAIGGIIKHNASISGAECGCQAEVGSASAMAAAGLCAVLGGTNAQIENAAEIALEHHLGMTCDPVKGLVQVPCIERNGLGAIKAVSAASLALHGDGTHIVPLDACIETMRQTGRDMQDKYKETSLGGLAVNLPEC